jgi:hypothetical protein
MLDASKTVDEIITILPGRFAWFLAGNHLRVYKKSPATVICYTCVLAYCNFSHILIKLCFKTPNWGLFNLSLINTIVIDL